MKTVPGSRPAFRSDHPDALAIYCSDGRFTAAVEGLLEGLGHDRLDTLTIPGGPAVLDSGSSSLLESDSLRRATTFLIVGHRIKHVILVAHGGCGYYRAKNPYDDAETTHSKQLGDLRLVGDWVSAAHKDVVVSGYFARPDGAVVSFDEVYSSRRTVG